VRRFKKIIAVSLILAISIFLIPAAPAGASPVKHPGNIVTPLYIDIDTFTNYFNITSSGKAEIYSLVCSGTADRIVITCYLEKLKPDGGHTLIKSWTSSGSGSYAYCSEQYYVTHGTYRLKSCCYVYRDGLCTDYDCYISYTVTY
jgi:hypothetical protein